VSPDEFNQFQHEAVRALISLMKDCKRKYSDTEWPRWDYDLHAGTLTFSADGIPKVVAAIQVVGTTQNASHRWTWAWANESLPLNVTEYARKVRQFGLAEGLSRLTEPELVDDQHLGWVMTAIMARITGAKGAFECGEDHGFMYVLYTDIHAADSQPAASPAPPRDDGKIDCKVHGVAPEAFACEHLVLDPKQAWFSENPTAEDPWPDAWCAKCDLLYKERGCWDEENTGQLKINLICNQCYEALRNQEPRK